MKQLVTTGIVLKRLDYGEADRILTVLTPDYGKLSLLAKGVRRVKSKLAGGIELFSISSITFIKGRSSLDNLVSTRLVKHYAEIVKELDRTMLGYELMKQLNRVTEDELEPEYFYLTEQLFDALDDSSIKLAVIRFWFAVQLLRLAGHTPNLQTNTLGGKLDAGKRYDFDFDHMAFAERPAGRFVADHIKYLRLGFSNIPAKTLQQIRDGERLLVEVMPVVQAMLQTFSLV